MNCHALAGGCNGALIWFRDRPSVPQGTEPLVGVHRASPGYFQTARISLLRGRGFSDGDRQGAPKVVLINGTAARRSGPRRIRSASISVWGRAASAIAPR
jgi:hypothetical protein